MVGERVAAGMSAKLVLRTLAILGAVAFMTDLCVGQTALRSVTGRVTDDSGSIVEGAVVQLSNVLTYEVRSYITQSDGLYRFHGLHPLIDFKVRAQYEGRRSRSRTVSRFDANSIVRIDLQIRAYNRRSEGQETSAIWSGPRLTQMISTPFNTFSTGVEAIACSEMTKAIEYWENECGRNGDLAMVMRSEIPAMPDDTSNPMRLPLVALTSRRVELPWQS